MARRINGYWTRIDSHQAFFDKVGLDWGDMLFMSPYVPPFDGAVVQAIAPDGSFFLARYHAAHGQRAARCTDLTEYYDMPFTAIRAVVTQLAPWEGAEVEREAVSRPISASSDMGALWELIIQSGGWVQKDDDVTDEEGRADR